MPFDLIGSSFGEPYLGMEQAGKLKGVLAEQVKGFGEVFGKGEREEVDR